MKLTRRQRRWYFRRTQQGKRILKLPFMHTDKIENRRGNLETGKQVHEEFTTNIQEKIYERLALKEASLIKELEGKNIPKNEIDQYIEIWSATVIWPKQNDNILLRKELKKLNKKFGVNG